MSRRERIARYASSRQGMKLRDRLQRIERESYERFREERDADG